MNSAKQFVENFSKRMSIIYIILNKIITYLNFSYFVFTLKKNIKKKKFLKKIITTKKITKKIITKKNIAFELQTFNIEILYLIFISFLSLKNSINLKIYYYLKKNDIFSNIVNRIFILVLKKITYLTDIKFINYCYLSSNSDAQKKMVNKIFNKLKSKRDVLKIKYKNYEIGRYIYQSYCREQFKFELDIKDIILKHYILEGFLYVDNSIDFFVQNKVEHTFVSHGTYLKYSIFSKVAQKNKSLVSIMLRKGPWSAIRFIELRKNLYPNADYENFKSNFKKIKDKKQKILSSKKELDKISSGSFKNPLIHKFEFADKEFDFTRDKSPNKILVLPPCMFDALLQFHKIGNYIEPYNWLKFTLDNAVKTNFSWYVKPHPSGHKRNDKIFDALKKEYPKITFLDKAIFVKKNHFKSVFTYQSTGAHEYINSSVPVVIAEDNAQSSFRFGRSIKLKSTYKKLIFKADKITLQKNDDIYKFYYMFNNGASNFFEYKFMSDKIFHKNFDKEYIKYSYKNVFYNTRRFNTLVNAMNINDYKVLTKLIYDYIFIRKSKLMKKL